MSGAAVVRPARPDDAGALGRCHLACWDEAYTGLVDGPGFRAALTRVDERVERWRRVLAGPHGTVVAVVAGEGAGDAADEQVVGFASAGPQRDEDVDLPRELYALYVRRARWGTGLGHRLLQTVVGDDPCSLWVFRDNARARGFYARHGFQPDGAAKVEPFFGGAEVRLVRRAGPPATAG
ncbi:GNAT family N-acetyltransferase [Microlunatus capsulatus]|uniref:GNAT superfamily N-acetyltransferase n=1 Tax=Microlunatus capsulatus TaxID=99117 RepID=A0ABS4Z3N5_9ACTN|nr:GNAT family N-acetyltransferase [Microlunatus capsulatus]MBP2415666.1 GNAT superfamily N-acetyltransferase [Microlunatus capsulatus]